MQAAKKDIASAMSVIGMVSGLFFSMGPWIFGVSRVAASSYTGPVIFGATLIAIHWFTYRKIQSGSPSRLGLIVSNMALLAFMIVGFLYIIGNAAADNRPYVRVVLLASVFIAPLISNAAFLLILRRVPADPFQKT